MEFGRDEAFCAATFGKKALSLIISG
jgi:hypothetical protein